MRARIIAIFMTAVLLTVLFGCSSSGGGEAATTDRAQESQGAQIQPRPVAEDKTQADFEKRTFEILARDGEAQSEFDISGNGGTSVLGEAVYRRNITVQTRLNCTLEFSYSDGTVNGAESFIKDALANEKYDVFAAHNLVMTSLAIKGECADLASLQAEGALDLSSPWWPNNLVERLAYDGRLYFCTGDISTSYLSSLYATFFNKDILNAKGIEPTKLYIMVENGSWTLEALSKYINDCAGDVNGEMVHGFALGVNPEYVEAFYCAANFTPTVRDGEGKLAFSMTNEDLEEETDFLKILNGLFTSENSSVSWSNASNGTARFTSGNAAFTISPISYAKELEGRFDYGVIPLPVAQVRTDTYLTPVSDGYTFYAVHSKNAESDRAAATVLESLGATAYNMNAEAYYKSLLGISFDMSDPDVRMIEHMKDNGCFEFFECWLSAYTTKEGVKLSNPSQLFASCVINSSATHIAELNYAQLIETYRPIYKEAFDEIIKEISGK